MKSEGYDLNKHVLIAENEDGSDRYLIYEGDLYNEDNFLNNSFDYEFITDVTIEN